MITRPPNGGPDVGTADPTDGRAPLDWNSRYPPDARKQIRLEALYTVGLFGLSLLLIFLTWKGTFGSWLYVRPDEAVTFKKYCYYAFSGLLGGTVFGIKYLYRVVARGYWHVDRRLWRFLSPLAGLGVAFALGALFEASLIAVRTPTSGAAIVGVGFLIGYFADAAVGKMHEIADVLFGTTIKAK